MAREKEDVGEMNSPTPATCEEAACVSGSGSRLEIRRGGMKGARPPNAQSEARAEKAIREVAEECLL